MNIGIDASRYGDKQATGVEWYSYYIINSLLVEIIKYSEDTVVLYSKKKLNFPQEIDELIKKNKARVKFRIIEAKRFWTLFALSKEMRINPPDALFVPSHTFPLIVPKKSMIMIHDIAFKKFPKFYSWKQYLYLNWSCKFAIKHSTKLVVPSQATKDDIVSEYGCDPDKIDVVLHGYKKEIFTDKELVEVMNKAQVFKHFKIDEKSKYFFYIGRLESKKNIVNLIKAFKLFLDDFSEARLVLGGKRGFGFKEILKTVNKLGLGKNVVMPGYLTEKEKAALMKKSVAFIFPSSYEGFGLPILEAFSYETPVICSNVSSLPEVAGEAVEYISPDNIDDIATALKKVYVDENYAKDLVNRGNKQLKKFSWLSAAKKTKKILTSL